VQLVEHVAGKSELLQIDDLNLHALGWTHIPDFKIEDVLTLGVELAVGCFLSLLHCFLVLDPRLFLLLYHSFESALSELRHESVDTGIGVDGKAVLKL